MAGVVHHGGAGTTAAGLKAGKPNGIVAFFGEQFFWGPIVQKRKVGRWTPFAGTPLWGMDGSPLAVCPFVFISIGPCPGLDLSEDWMTETFRALASGELAEAAEELGKTVR